MSPGRRALLARWVAAGALASTAASAAAPTAVDTPVGAAASVAAAPAPIVSADGRWRLSVEGDQVVVQAVGEGTRRQHRAVSLDGRERGRASALRALPARRSFALAFEGLPELWEIPLDVDAEPIFDGYVHDYRMGEGIARPGFLGVRRVRLQEPLAAFAADASGAYVLGRVADGAVGHGAAAPPRARLVLVHLDVRRPIARFALEADPDLGAAQTLQEEGRSLLVVPDRRGGPPLRLDLRAARLLPRRRPRRDRGPASLSAAGRSRAGARRECALRACRCAPGPRPPIRAARARSTRG
jgi:hypothetical protein